MTFGLVPEILNAVDVIMTVCKELRMINAKVAEIGYIQHVVSAPTVRIDGAVRHNFAFYNRDQRSSGSIRNDLSVNLTTPVSPSIRVRTTDGSSVGNKDRMPRPPAPSRSNYPLIPLPFIPTRTRRSIRDSMPQRTTAPQFTTADRLRPGEKIERMNNTMIER